MTADGRDVLQQLKEHGRGVLFGREHGSLASFLVGIDTAFRHPEWARALVEVLVNDPRVNAAADDLAGREESLRWIDEVVERIPLRSER